MTKNRSAYGDFLAVLDESINRPYAGRRAIGPVSAMALMIGLMAEPIPSHAACSDSTPDSGDTVNCTFDADTNGDPIPITTPIIAPDSTNVTVNIQDIDRPASDRIALFGAGTPSINLGGGADITILNVDVANFESENELLDAVEIHVVCDTCRNSSPYLINSRLKAINDGVEAHYPSG